MSTASPTPCPCMLYKAQNSNAVNEKSALRLAAAQKEHSEFINRYRIKAQSYSELQSMLAGNLAKQKVLVTQPISTGKLQSMPFGYVAKANNKTFPQAKPIYTDIFSGMGVAKVFFPWEDTPVCDGTHLPSILDTKILVGLKKAGIDVILFETPGIPDTLCRWVREQLGAKGLSRLMPDVLPEGDLDAKVSLFSNMPVIVPVANPGMEDINYHGLALLADDHRLGIVSHRAYAIYDKSGSLLHLEKADDPSLEKCNDVLGSAMLKKVESFNMLNKPALEL